jgi:dephospho-CoA kinase
VELKRFAAAAVVVLMVPLLFEAGLEGMCSEIWLVDCDAQQQLERLCRRDGYDHAEAEARLAAQWPMARKFPLADVVIDNNSPPGALLEQVERALAAGAGGARESPTP